MELHAQVFSEVYGGTGGVCGLRLPLEQQLSDPASAGFRYDDCDKCFRCDGVSCFEGARFVEGSGSFMLPPFALDNDGSWKLSPECAEWLPVELTRGDDVFKLAGVTMFANDHFTSLIRVDNQWHFYDGLKGQGELKVIDFLEMKKLKYCLCYAYYLLP